VAIRQRLSISFLFNRKFWRVSADRKNDAAREKGRQAT
jgi:hypothetical protein